MAVSSMLITMFRQLPVRWYYTTAIIMLLVELLSWLSFGYPQWALELSALLIGVVFIVANYRLVFGIAAIMGELVIGSQGHLLPHLR